MRKPIEAFKMNNHAHSFMMCHESDVRKLECDYEDVIKKSKELAALFLDFLYVDADAMLKDRRTNYWKKEKEFVWEFIKQLEKEDIA